MTDATFYLAFTCFALAVLSADRIWSIVLITAIAFVGTTLLIVLGIAEGCKALLRRGNQ